MAKLQVALDFLNLSRALGVARLAAAAGEVILEAGTPLIKSEGLNAVRALRKSGWEFSNFLISFSIPRYPPP